MEEQIREIERKDGVRLPYNVFPLKPLESLPLSVLYSPLQKLDTLLPYEPIFCSQCRSILSPFCEINYNQKTWTCIFCKKVSVLPVYLKDISPNNLPLELIDTTVEYELLKECSEPCFLFLIDVCTFDMKRQALLVDAVRVSFELLPEDSLVCFVTFGTNINLICDDKIRRTFVFSGGKKYERNDLQRLFERENEKISGLKSQSFLVKKFFRRKSSFSSVSDIFNNLSINSSNNCANDISYKNFNNSGVASDNENDSGINNYANISGANSRIDPRNIKSTSLNKDNIEDFSTFDTSFIQKDPFPVNNGMRPLRCTGSAISFATSLIDTIDTGSKIFLFTQGPCTYGPGTICSLTLKDSIRSLSDILKGKSVYTKSAQAFYTELANKLALQSTALDILGATIEDIGLYEMKSLCDLTGGNIIMAQDFDRKIYLSSLIKHFKNPDLDYSHLKKYFKNTGKANQSISKKNFTGLESIDELENSDYAGENHVDSYVKKIDDEFTIENKHTQEYYFDISKAIQSLKGSEKRYNARIKIQTTQNINYKGAVGPGISTANIWRLNNINENTNLTFLFEPQAPKNEDISYIQIITKMQKGRKTITRVSTIARLYNDETEKVVLGFDQEAAAVLLARLYTSINRFEEDMDLVRRIDRSLIRFVKKYGSFAKDDVSSVTLPDSLSFFPNFMYFLRRSVIVHTVNSSPDETSYYRTIVARERVTEAMTVIYPILTSYHYQEGIEPVEIDSKSLRKDTILVLDTFSHVLIWKGEHVANWIKQGIHKQAQYKPISDIIDAALDGAKNIINERLPTPVFICTESGESQERILLSRVNPNRHGTHIVTDDIDFETFFRCLCKIVVEG